MLIYAFVVSFFLIVSQAVASPLTYDLLPETVEFRKATLSDNAQNNCVTCHSIDYITFQPPNMGASFWNQTVQKMIKVYRAPIDEPTAQAIGDYLSKNY